MAAITATGAQAIGVPTDVTDGAAVDALRDAAIERFGNIHVLCNNAGVGGGGPSGGAFVNEPEWRWVLEVNLFGVIHGHRAFLPHMTGHGEGGLGRLGDDIGADEGAGTALHGADQGPEAVARRGCEEHQRLLQVASGKAVPATQPGSQQVIPVVAPPAPAPAVDKVAALSVS